MDIEEMKTKLEAALPAKRYHHSVLVYETALELAKAHGIEPEKVGIAALLHDCGREIPNRENLRKAKEFGLKVDKIERNQPILLHAKLGAYLAKKKYGVKDKEILDGIRYHTTGKEYMSKLAMVVYLADLLEPDRDFEGVEDMRRLAQEDLERCIFEAYGQTMRYLLDYELLIHPDCMAGYNHLAIKYKRLKKFTR